MINILRIILFPILFAFLAVILESTAGLVKGLSIGDKKYKVWVNNHQQDGSPSISALQGLSVQDIQQHDNVIEIERMVNFHISDFSSVGFDLILAAFCIDVISLLDCNGILKIGAGWVLFGHIILLITILLCYNLSLVLDPSCVKKKTTYSTIAILLGTFAMMIAFFVS